jgi:DeoR family suf operon transcriptional repressor
VSLSPAATRQQLMALTLQGLVQYHQVRQGPGRPRHVYSLTPDGESLFPQAYDEALDIILSSLGEEDPETRVRVLLRARNLSYERNLSQLRSNDPAGRLEEVRAALERGGYDPVVSWKVTDQAELSLLNCPLASLVERSRGVCDAELENIQRALPGAAVERTEYRPTGSMRCSYEMTFVSDRG